MSIVELSFLSLTHAYFSIKTVVESSLVAILINAIMNDNE